MSISGIIYIFETVVTKCREPRKLNTDNLALTLPSIVQASLISAETFSSLERNEIAPVQCQDKRYSQWLFCRDSEMFQLFYFCTTAEYMVFIVI